MLTEKAANATTNTAYTVGAVTAGAGALTLSDWALIVGIFGTLATLVMNYYYQRRRLRIEAEHKEWIRENSPTLIDNEAGRDGSPDA
ncbi:HP1 family phage holin [Aliidiomarina sp. Khilg15.8]